MDLARPPSERRPRLRTARGPRRPVYLGDPDQDRLMMMLMALMAEVSALRERLDTHEALAARGIAATAEATEAFVRMPADDQRRSATRDAMLRRVLRVVLQELESTEDAGGD